MGRQLDIFLKLPDGTMLRPALVTDYSDTLGIIGEVLSLISQLDSGDQVVINCYGEDE